MTEPRTAEPTAFCKKMFNRFLEAAYTSGWTTRRAPNGEPSFYAHKRKQSMKITFGPNGNLAQVKFAGEDIPIVAAVGLLPLLFEMKDFGDE